MLRLCSRLWSKVKEVEGLTGELILAAVSFVLLALPQKVQAQINIGNEYGSSNANTTIKGWVDNIGNVVVPALMGVFFIGGVVMAGAGIFAFANKDSNQQGAQGAWKKVAAGAILLAFGVLLGVLKTTMSSSG